MIDFHNSQVEDYAAYCMAPSASSIRRHVRRGGEARVRPTDALRNLYALLVRAGVVEIVD
ncbi:hypothetical protein [Rhodococcus sp. JS3073]|uniref:hypothetical protein n=1 Tax=Rhodococcus sp. JS3073 TaxID=3002901 RepID=UPI0022869383|nr:hypothetical protein [Rhodococcus sp. JS3073]WAM19428.1 hypothetical protein OYT95_43990 [Rhodococcus sp. JS3073]